MHYYPVKIVLAAILVVAALLVGRSSWVSGLLLHADGYTVDLEQPAWELESQPDQETVVCLRFRNLTAEPVSLEGISTGCSCTRAENIPCEIAPYGMQEVRLTVDTHGYAPGEWLELAPEYYVNRATRKRPLSIRVHVIP